MSVSVAIRKNLGAFRLQVDFEAENEILALLGASGSGKSMTLKCIAGIEKPDEGRIVLDGRVLFDSAQKINLSPQKRRVGYLFQNYALFPNMTVEENIAAGVGLPKEQKRELVRNKIESLFLQGLEKRYPAQLSGGQQQRVALARILASEPDILLLDEPFSALDSYLRWQMEQELSGALERFAGTTLFVSHNRDEVYRICGRIAVISDGELDGIHDKWELFRQPRTVAAALLTGCKNVVEAKKRSEYSVEVPGWGTVLHTEQPVPDGLTSVGVRAHYFQPAYEQSEQNVIPGRIFRVIEDTFSMIVLYRPPGRSEIRWELEKENFLGLRQAGGPAYLKVQPKDILLLVR